MSQLYVRTAAGALPVDLESMKEYLKLDQSVTADDEYVTLLLNAAADVAERAMHGREIRSNSYQLFVDEFQDRICLAKDVVDAASVVVEYLVDDAWTAVAASTYYVKRHVATSEVVLAADQSWPTDGDDVEHGVRITFSTVPGTNLETSRAAIARHVSFMYENRGDCDPASAQNSFVASGADGLLGIAAVKLV